MDSSPTASDAISLTDSPSPTVTVVSPSGEPPAEMSDFRAFAAQIALAISDGDGEFFGSRGVEVEVVCQGDEQVGQCFDQPAGTLLRGIPGAAWQSDAGGLIPVSDFGAATRNWWSSAIDVEDAFGLGQPRLFAIGATSDGLMSLQTVIANDPQTHEQERQALAFVWKVDGEDWALLREMSVFYQQGAQDWLSGTCSECYDYFELWSPTD